MCCSLLQVFFFPPLTAQSNLIACLYRDTGSNLSSGGQQPSIPLRFKFDTVFTTLPFNSPVLQRTVRFCEQLSTVIPNSHVYYRRGLALKRIIPQCIARDFTDLIVINEDRKIPSILLCIC